MGRSPRVGGVGGDRGGDRSKKNFCPDRSGEPKSTILCEYLDTFFGNRPPKSPLVSVFGLSKSCLIYTVKWPTPNFPHQSSFKIDFEGGTGGGTHKNIKNK